jgi:oligopeptide transport system permease protein
MTGEIFRPDDFDFMKENRPSEDLTLAVRPFWKDVLYRLARNKGAIFGLICIVLIVAMALVGPLLTPYSFDRQIAGNENMAPRIPWIEKFGLFDGREVLHTSSSGVVLVYKYGAIQNGENTYYWFGSDSLGRDIFARTCEGARISLFIALIAVVADIFIGVAYGFISGYFGGWVDIVMQRLVEILNGIPTLVIVTLLIMVLKPGIYSVMFTIILTGWIGMSNMARTQVLKLKEREFVLAAKTLGAGDLSVIFKEIFPNVMGQLITISMFSVPDAIFTEAFLSFIGIGIPVPLASLGSLISEGFKSLTTHPYMIIPPAAILALLMLCFNLLADGLRDAFDPKMRDI